MTKKNIITKRIVFFFRIYYYETVLKKERKKINLLKFFPHLSILDYITYILYGIYPRAFEN